MWQISTCAGFLGTSLELVPAMMGLYSDVEGNWGMIRVKMREYLQRNDAQGRRRLNVDQHARQLMKYDYSKNGYIFWEIHGVVNYARKSLS